MTRRNWSSMAVAVAVLLAGTPAIAAAKHGADDPNPKRPDDAQPHGLKRHGADDKHPEPVGVRLARRGADDKHPEPVGVRLARRGADDKHPEPVGVA